MCFCEMQNIKCNMLNSNNILLNKKKILYFIFLIEMFKCKKKYRKVLSIKYYKSEYKFII